MYKIVAPRLQALLILCALPGAPSGAFAQSSFDCAAPSPPTLVSPVVLGNGSAGSVTTSQLQQALDDGGPIRLNVGSSTLVVNPTLTVKRASVLDLAGAS